MKHHGQYTLPTPDELLLDIEAGCSKAYIRKQAKRHRQKHRNDKRHLEKHKQNPQTTKI